jgi:hypothetical protein
MVKRGLKTNHREPTKHVEENKEKPLTKKEQKNLAEFFGESKPRVRGAGPIYENFP